MFLAVVFEIWIAKGIARSVARNVVVRIAVRFSSVRFVIWEIAKAAPVLDFWKRIRVMKEIDMTIVLIEPRRIRNCSLVVFLERLEAIIAAWLLPSPGKREQIGEMKIVRRVGFMISFFGMFRFFISCFGRTVFDFIEWIRVEVAKSPVRRGRSGFAISRFSEASPRKPESRKIIRAFSLPFFSLKIRSIAIQIRRRPIILWRSGYIFGMIRMKIGMIRIREIIAMVEPKTVSFRASWPLPWRRSSWPGRTERLVSSEGAPRKIEGMKSRKVWVIAIETMKIRRVVVGRFWVRVKEIAVRATRLMWIPGIRPVRVPVRVPRSRERRSWIILFLIILKL